LASRTEQRRAAVWALYQSDLLDRPLEFDQDTHTFAIGLAEAVRDNQDELEPGNTPIPPEGAIDEAVETAKEFCGADAPKFVNGVLAAALREMQSQPS
jgi:N utilization substance protein B